MIFICSITERNALCHQFVYFCLELKIWYPWLHFYINVYQNDDGRIYTAGHLGKWWFAQPRIKGVQ